LEIEIGFVGDDVRLRASLGATLRRSSQTTTTKGGISFSDSGSKNGFELVTVDCAPRYHWSSVDSEDAIARTYT
jgi:hypothetical protein